MKVIRLGMVIISVLIVLSCLLSSCASSPTEEPMEEPDTETAREVPEEKPPMQEEVRSERGWAILAQGIGKAMTFQSAFATEDYLYVAGNLSGFYILKIQGGGELELVSSLDRISLDPGRRLTNVYVRGDIAYVGSESSWGSLIAIDVSDPSHPKALEEKDTGDISDMCFEGDYGYLVTHHQDFYIVDLANNEGVAHTRLEGMGWLTSCSAYGNMVCITSENKMKLIDVSDKKNPRETATYEINESYIMDSYMKGGYVYISSPWGDTDNSIIVLDIRNNEAPQKVAEIRTDNDPRKLSGRGDLLYVAGSSWDIGLKILDISNPESPRIVNETPNNFLSGSIALSGDYAYLTGEQAFIRLKVVDISDPAQPALVHEVQGRDEIRDIAIKGDYAYLACGEGGISIVDASNQSSPRVVSENLGELAENIAIKDDTLFIARGWSTIGVMEIGSAPEVRRSRDSIADYEKIGNIVDLCVSGNYLYAFGDRNENPMLNIIDPSSIEKELDKSIIKTLQISNERNHHIAGIAASGDFAYFAWRNDKEMYTISIVDVSNPEEAEVVREITLPECYGISIRGDELICAAGSMGALIFDISNPLEASPSGTLVTPDHIRGITADEDYLYLICSKGIIAVPYREGEPSPIMTYIALPAASGVAAYREAVFIAGGASGLTIIGN